MEYFKGILKKEVSLCCLYQKGRCHAHDKCHQIHVDTGFMRAIRQQNAHIISCCRHCRDTASLSGQAISFFATHFGDSSEVKIVCQDGSFNKVPVERVAMTTGLSIHVDSEGAPTQLPAKKMCRLHLRGACKYGKDCKNIHVCTKLGERVLSPPSSPVPEPRQSDAHPSTPTPAVAHDTSRRSSGSLFDRVAENPGALTESSERGYFDSRRFAVLPETEKAVPEFNIADAVGNISFMEKSVNIAGLCFDPALLAEPASPKHHKVLSADWFDASMDCGCSSTSSQLSAQARLSINNAEW